MTQIEAPKREPDEVDPPIPGTPADDHHDPLHDIDAKKTIIAVGGTLFAIVFLCWSMTHLYGVMVKVERDKKIADIVPKELLEIRAENEGEIAGKNAQRGAMTIEQAMAAYRANPNWKPK